jgi:hypothetical protein
MDKDREPRTDEDVKGEEQAESNEPLKDLEPQGDVKGGGMYWDDSAAGS